MPFETSALNKSREFIAHHGNHPNLLKDYHDSVRLIPLVNPYPMGFKNHSIPSHVLTKISNHHNHNHHHHHYHTRHYHNNPNTCLGNTNASV